MAILLWSCWIATGVTTKSAIFYWANALFCFHGPFTHFLRITLCLFSIRLRQLRAWIRRWANRCFMSQLISLYFYKFILLFNFLYFRTINDKDPRKKVLKLIVEWSSSVRHEFSRGPTESVVNDFSFLHDGTETGKTNDFGGYEQIPIPLVNLLEDYIKRG